MIYTCSLGQVISTTNYIDYDNGGKLYLFTVQNSMFGTFLDSNRDTNSNIWYWINATAGVRMDSGYTNWELGQGQQINANSEICCGLVLVGSAYKWHDFDPLNFYTDVICEVR